MKHSIITLFLFLITLLEARDSFASVFDGNVKIVGNLYCEVTKGELRPVSKLIVELNENPASNTLSIDGTGYFELKVPFSLIDKQVILIVKNNDKELISEVVSTSRDSEKFNRRSSSLIIKMKKEIVVGDCGQIAPFDRAYFNEYSKVRSEENLEFGYGAGSFLNYLALIPFSSSGAGLPGEEPIITRVETSQLPLRISNVEENENVFEYARNQSFSQYGFRYSLGRSGSNSIVSNASLMSFSVSEEINSNFEFGRNGIFWSVNSLFYTGNRLSFGAAYLIHYNEYDTDYFYADELSNKVDYALFENGLILSGAYRLSENLAFGLASKYLYQKFKVPEYVQRNSVFGYYESNPEEEYLIEVVDTTVANRISSDYLDFDASFSFDFSKGINLGGTLLGILGSKEYIEGEYVSNRGAGVGVTMFSDRLQYGMDVEYAKYTGFNSSVGLNYQYNNAIEISAGYLTKGQSIKLSVKYESLFLSMRSSNDGFFFSSGARLRF